MINHHLSKNRIGCSILFDVCNLINGLHARGGGAGGAGDRVLITLYEMIETREEELGFTSTILAIREENKQVFANRSVFCDMLEHCLLRSYYRIFLARNTDNMLFP